eukprot:jgi/Mesvir1/13211/Mv06169-RA.1
MSTLSGSQANSVEVARAQADADATLNDAYEQEKSHGVHFDYGHKVLDANQSARMSESSGGGTSFGAMAYATRMQRPGIIQSYGCCLVVDAVFKIIAASENALTMLTGKTVQDKHAIIGQDSLSLFSVAAAAHLKKAASSKDLGVVNPVAVFAAGTGKPFFAIMHRNDVGLVIDLEPIHPQANTGPAQAGALASHKLASDSVAKLQCVGPGNLDQVYKILVEEVRSLTGYDRVMVYKFHPDMHGEVVAESVDAGVEQFLGLHYPATDIPQAARALFVRNRVRMIADVTTESVPMLQDSYLKHPVDMSFSTLRGVLHCHREYMANMGSLASLVMAVVVNEYDESDRTSRRPIGQRLWGLVVCHHITPRVVLYPLRSACSFLVQVFSLQINAEMERTFQQREKEVIRTQAILCDMLQRDAPIGIVTQTPNIMDLVPCDGAGLWYGGRFWSLGVTPSEDAVEQLVKWMLMHHGDSTGLSTDSLTEAGYPGAEALASTVCGLAACRITENDFLMWFRGPTNRTINWAGQTNDPNAADDQKKMHPRASFAAFQEVVRGQSAPWEDGEMDIIHSLQLILRGQFADIEDVGVRTMIHLRLNQLRLKNIDEVNTVASEMVRLIETASAPIFAVNLECRVSAWNGKMAQLTGVPFEEAVNLPLIDHFLMPGSKHLVMRLMQKAHHGEEVQNVEICLRTKLGMRGAGSSGQGGADGSSDMEVGSAGASGSTTLGGDDGGHRVVTLLVNTDQNGYVVEWNPNMERISGLSKEEVLRKLLLGEVFGMDPKHCMLVLPDQETRVQFEIMLNRAVGGMDNSVQPFSFIDKSGKNRRMQLNVSKRLDNAGNITGLFCFLQDMSAELEDVLRIQMAASSAVEELAKELQYLREQTRPALAGIRTSAALVQRTDMSEGQRQMIEAIASCEEQIRKVVDKGDLQAVEDGTAVLAAKPFSMSALVNTVISEGMEAGSAKGIQITQSVPGDCRELEMVGDRVRMQQVLSQFVHTSIGLTKKGFVELGVRLVPPVEGEPGTPQRVRFKVMYTGQVAALPRELQEELVDMDMSVQRPEGLGLNVCNKLVRLMGGTCSYQTEVEKGYSFLVTMPLPAYTGDKAMGDA